MDSVPASRLNSIQDINRIDPDSSDDGHSLRHLDGQPFVGAITEIMEVVKRYRSERHRYYSGGYINSDTLTTDHS